MGTILLSGFLSWIFVVAYTASMSAWTDFCVTVVLVVEIVFGAEAVVVTTTCVLLLVLLLLLYNNVYHRSVLHYSCVYAKILVVLT